MVRRLAAAAAGIVLIAAAVLVFLLGKHPVVAGTNTAAPVIPALPLSGGETRCQAISRVPARTTHVRVVVDSMAGPPGRLRVIIYGAGRVFAAKGGTRVNPGGVVIPLVRRTGAVHPGTLCIAYLGRGRVVLAGERKRVPRDFALPGQERRAVASAVYLRPGLESWGGRREVIIDRFGNAQAGSFGGWAIWAAGGLALAAGLLTLCWLVFRLEAPVEGRAR
jgi:hypothetical protein